MNISVSAGEMSPISTALHCNLEGTGATLQVLSLTSTLCGWKNGNSPESSRVSFLMLRYLSIYMYRKIMINDARINHCKTDIHVGAKTVRRSKIYSSQFTRGGFFRKRIKKNSAPNGNEGLKPQKFAFLLQFSLRTLFSSRTYDKNFLIIYHSCLNCCKPL